MNPSITVEGTENFNAEVHLDRSLALHFGFPTQGSAQIWAEKIAKKIQKQMIDVQEKSGIRRNWSM